MRKAHALLAAILLAALTSCGGSGAQLTGQPGPGPSGGAAAPGQTYASVLRDASGAPKGIHLQWVHVPSASQGYHIYVSQTSIPDTARGDDTLWLEIGGSTTIPQSPGPSTPIQLDHLFTPVIGDDWFYRVSSISKDDDGVTIEESALSPELHVQITKFFITEIVDETLRISDTVELNGGFFGDYNPVTDKLEFPGVQWVAGTGFQPLMLTALITEWTPTHIEATVPSGATSGVLKLTVDSMSADTPEVFQNTDPYITGLTPLSANVTNDVTLTGKNFGTVHDVDNYVQFGPSAIVDPTSYSVWTDGSIVFKPANLRDYQSQPVQILLGSGGQFQSNTGFVDLTNAPPVAFLTATPASGEAPLDVTLKPARDDGTGLGVFEFSFDPEGAPMTYGYDWTNDNSIDFTRNAPVDVIHNYGPGEFEASLTLTDADGAASKAKVSISVDPPAVDLSDHGSIGPTKLFAPTRNIKLDYTINGGIGPFSIDWLLVDSTDAETGTVLGHSTGIAGPGNFNIGFNVDTLVTSVADDSMTLPRGKWRIKGVIHDAEGSIDPDDACTWPQGGGLPVYEVYRYNVSVINEAAGDPGSTETSAVAEDLQFQGYLVNEFSGSTVTLANVQSSHAVLIAGSGVTTAPPYSWIPAGHLAMLRQFVDLGGSAIILAPPGGDAVSLFPQDNSFDTDYQPFTNVTGSQSTATMNCASFTGNKIYTLPTFIYSPAVPLGTMAVGIGMQGTSTIQATNTNGLRSAAIREQDATGKVYIGMFVYSVSSPPAPALRSHLIENIVAGSIEF